MRTALIKWGTAAAIAVNLFPMSESRAADYAGPGTIMFDANGGPMGVSRSGSVDLRTGLASVAGPRGPVVRCGSSDQRQLTLSATDLAMLRSLASEIHKEGLNDTACLDHQRKKAEREHLRLKKEADDRQADWHKAHSKYKGPAPIFPIATTPMIFDGGASVLRIEGVGAVTIESGSDCITPATRALLNKVSHL